jgi:hypothetical protein
MFAKERLYLTAKRDRIVLEGDKSAATLYAAPGDEIPQSAVDRFGLVDGTIKGRKAAASDDKGGAKEKAPGQGKEKQPDGDKGGGTKGAGAAADDDLTRIKFVGPAVAAGLVKAGFATIAQVAAIDPAKPPAVDGTGARTNWSGIVASAIELHEDTDTEQGDGAASGDGAGAGAADQQAN